MDTTTDPPTTGTVAKNALFARRPGLGDLDLSCDNANVPVPYIDLVCELLEELISPDPGLDFTGNVTAGAPTATFLSALQAEFAVTDKAQIFPPDVNGDFILRDKNIVLKIHNTGGNNWNVKELHQTYGTAEELAARPYYLNEAAYMLLKTSNYAFDLPYDNDHTEASAIFDRFNIARADLMKAFQAALLPTDLDIAAERLGLTKQEKDLVISVAPGSQQTYWNTSGSAVSEMEVVRTMLDKTGLTFKELEELLDMSFLDADLFIKHGDETCDLGNKTIENLTTAVLDRIHRFLRLSKTTGWSFPLTDALIAAPGLGDGDLDGDCLTRLGELLEVQSRTGIKIETLSGCYGDIPHLTNYNKKYVPLYQKVFLNKAVNGTIDEGLMPENVSDGTPPTTVLLADHKSSIALALQITEGDFDLLIAPMADKTLTWSNLSYLYASSVFCRNQKLTVKDYLIYKELSGIEPFDSPADTLDFLEKIKKSAASGLSPADIKFMLWHEAEDLEIRIIPDDKILDVLTVLQEAYTDAFVATASAFSAAKSVEELTVDLKAALQKLPSFTEEGINDIVRMALGDWSSPPLVSADIIIDAYLLEYLDTTPVKAAFAGINTGEDNQDPADGSTKKAFIQSMLDPLAELFYLLEKENILMTTVAEAYRQDDTLVYDVVMNGELGQPGGDFLFELLIDDSLIDTTDPMNFPAIDEASYPKQYAALRLLNKLLPLVESFGMDPSDVEWWINAAPAMNWLLVDYIPYDATHTDMNLDDFLALSEMVRIAGEYPPLENPADPEYPFTVVNTLELLLDGTTTTAEWLDQFSVITGYDRERVEDLDGYFGWSVPNLDDYRDPETWEKAARCLDYLRKMDVTVTQAVEACKDELTAADVTMLRTALKSRYSESLWLVTLKEIMDKIRGQKRDALVAYILATDPAFVRSDDLYGHYLIDGEMDACMPSSRIVQAHGTIQLFVQRCLMGLEPETAADTKNDPSWEQWKWMKMYRVWEANRKVFLYPENWIEPELLDDKSFLFQNLENELLQNELNEYTSEDAVIRYVEGLDDISFLEVMATYYETEVYTMHVFARSKGGDPPQYYYRMCERERYWTPWEKVPLEISSNQLLAFKRNSRLHLAWPVFGEEIDDDQIPVTPAVKTTSDTPSSKQNDPLKRLTISLAISQYANGMWKPKKISQDAIKQPDFTTDKDELDHNRYNLVFHPGESTISVFHSFGDGSYESHYLDGKFNIAGCQGYPELIDSDTGYFSDFYPDIPDTVLKPQRYFELGNFESPDSLVIIHVLSFLGLSDRLDKTPGKFRITHNFQFNVFDFIAYLFMLILLAIFGRKGFLESVKIPIGTLFPYFFEDSEHEYMAIPGMYGTFRDEEENTYTVRRTYSDMHKLLVDIWRLIEKYIEIYITTGDLVATLTQLLGDPDYLAIIEELEVYKTLSLGEEWRNFYHPMICRLRKVLYNDGVEGIMNREFQLEQLDFDFDDHYDPAPKIVQPYPVENFDFTSDGSYSLYNWELFYHTPLMIANRFRDDQKFDEAFQWYHYIFNPTGTLDGDAPQKYWVTKPFFPHTEADDVSQRIDVLLRNLATPGNPEIAELEFAIEQWREKPFRPHTVARFRPVAYQKTVLMDYLQALIDCGDYHFRIDTMESLVMATQYYVLANKLMGPKPRVVPPVVKPPYQTYNQIEADLDAFGNALVELESLIPDLGTLPEGGDELPPVPETLASLYFCIPINEKLMSFWDTIEERLLNIRHCRNIDGVYRVPALFAPPIDPGMLVRAAAAGLDISSIVAGLSAPLPNYRFNVLAQKATELIQEVRSLGNALLQALEKKDGEDMARLQNSLEKSVLKHMENIRKLQIDEAAEQITVLDRSMETVQERNDFYREIERMIPNEQLNLDKLQEGQAFQLASQIVQSIGAILGLIPDFNIGGHGAGGSPAFHATFGGSFLAEAANAASSVLNILSSAANYEANRASILGGYDRRWEDWKLQERSSDKELVQIEQQKIVAEIAKQRTEKELENHQLQIENNKKTADFLQDKYTNKELYQWMVASVSSVYFKAYQMAFDMAKMAEKCYQHELGNGDVFIDFGYWDSLKKGLLSSDKLLQDVKRMEVSYLEKNKREYEITKHVSLDMLDPMALLKLRATGACDFEIPEVLYDMDHPGHYFRRIKSVSISIPCIAGPYTSVSGKLSLISNKYRKNTDSSPAYDEDLNNDVRFVYNVGAIQSIATSSGQNDSGMFEFNFRDERYLPFEGTGAASTWRFELPDFQLFDYRTIRDVILHVKYTSREGGSTLRSLASAGISTLVDGIRQELTKTGLHKAVNLRYELPDVWHQLKTTGEAFITISKERLPYFAQLASTSIQNVMFFRYDEANPVSITVQVDDADLSLNRVDSWKLCVGETTSLSLDTTFKLNVALPVMATTKEIMMMIKYDF